MMKLKIFRPKQTAVDLMIFVHFLKKTEEIFANNLKIHNIQKIVQMQAKN